MNAMLQRIAWLAVAGAAGTVSRYLIQALAARIFGSHFPWGTLVVNVLGCFLFGVVWTLEQEHELVSPEARVALLVGFMGAFTTFSTFAFETATLAREPGLLYAAGNFVAHNVLGLTGVVAGVALVRQF
jgi:CrcB protein